jgi:hypothetical protein
MAATGTASVIFVNVVKTLVPMPRAPNVVTDRRLEIIRESIIGGIASKIDIETTSGSQNRIISLYESPFIVFMSFLVIYSL